MAMPSLPLRVAFAATLTSLLASGAASAQAPGDGFAPHAYVGAAWGLTRAQGDFEAQVLASASSLGAGSTISNLGSDRSDNGGKVYAGYAFHPNFAAELSYVDFGRFTGAYDVSGFNTFTRRYRANWRADGFALDAVASLPLGAGLTASARVGVMRSSLRFSHDTVPAGLDAFTAPTDSQWRPHFGVGLSYQLNRQIAVNLGWERTSGIGRTFTFGGPDADRTNGKLDYDLLSLGLTYRFR
ncbi:MAG: outer membrane beta-barrel protein [Burkholderiales bacterium]|nr:outer membrane beta-barrel protein [Pseudomonadota bacterium]MCC7067749.1 outer membrane beta-barrel protein [Burkholderiales bacterium]MCZ2134559.1 outer membrane beta-barrel protein [Burkholderiales bacterium]